MTAASLTWRAGGCHCGGVRFEVALPERVEAQTCNCSICARTGFVHIIVPESRFRITAGRDQLVEYTFNTGVAKHLFCAKCGVKSFYRPRSNPDGWSVNACCLDSTDGLELDISAFDGRNWEANAAIPPLEGIGMTGRLDAFSDRAPERVTYENESDEERLARRKARWTLTALLEAQPTA